MSSRERSQIGTVQAVGYIGVRSPTEGHGHELDQAPEIATEGHGHEPDQAPEIASQ